MLVSRQGSPLAVGKDNSKLEQPKIHVYQYGQTKGCYSVPRPTEFKYGLNFGVKIMCSFVGFYSGVIKMVELNHHCFKKSQIDQKTPAINFAIVLMKI